MSRWRTYLAIPDQLAILDRHHLHAGVAFTRNSLGTYMGGDGLLKTAAVDEPRWEYADGEFQGLLIEQASTNITKRSSEFNLWPWINISGSASFSLTTSPTGAANAMIVQKTGAGRAGVVQENTVVVGQTYTLSFYARAGNFNKMDASFVENGTTLVKSIAITLTADWKRYDLHWEMATSSMVIRLRLGDDANTGTVGNTIHLFGAQLEQLGTASSYIATAGSQVTRAGDIVEMADLTTFDFTNFGIFSEHNRTAGNEGTVYSIYKDTDNYISLASYPNGNNLKAEFKETGNLNVLAAVFGSRQLARSILGADADSARFHANAALRSIANPVLPDLSAAKLEIGGDGTNLRKWNGHIKRLYVLPKQFSESHANKITTL